MRLQGYEQLSSCRNLEQLPSDYKGAADLPVFERAVQDLVKLKNLVVHVRTDLRKE